MLVATEIVLGIKFAVLNARRIKKNEVVTAMTMFQYNLRNRFIFCPILRRNDYIPYNAAAVLRIFADKLA